jgi:hypothetical protein
MMNQPISIRLDDDARATLEEAAQEQHVGLGTYLRQLASAHATALRKARIRAESKRIGALVMVDPEARAFYDDWGAAKNSFFESVAPPLEQQDQVSA